MVAKLEAIAGYAPLFEAAYPGEAITPATIAKAIATFERTVVSADAPFDRWVAGDESRDQRRGEARLRAVQRARPTAPRATPAGASPTTASTTSASSASDLGRGALLHGHPGDAVTPSRRRRCATSIAAAPYMHDGSVATLEDVIDLYDRGGRGAAPSLSAEIKPLDLTRRREARPVAFLRTLTSDDRPVQVPTLPR